MWIAQSKLVDSALERALSRHAEARFELVALVVSRAARIGFPTLDPSRRARRKRTMVDLFPHKCRIALR